MIHDDLAATFLRATEAAALSAHKCVGIGDKHKADLMAVSAMRDKLNLICMDGLVVAGEGERDEAPMLHAGEHVGSGNQNDNQVPKIWIATDPLEGTNICANMQNGAMSLLAFTSEGGFASFPDVYMEKIAIGADAPSDLISLDYTVGRNLGNISDFYNKPISEITVAVLDRERHKKLIHDIRESGAKVKLYQDGDVSSVIMMSMDENCEHDAYMGTGGSPEGLLAASALACIGGTIYGRLVLDNDTLKEKAKNKFGITEFNMIYSKSDLVKKECCFIASGVTHGEMLNGISYSSKSGRIRIPSKTVNSMIISRMCVKRVEHTSAASL